MPAPGFCTITVSTTTYDELVAFTKELKKKKGVPVSIPAAIKYLVKNCKPEEAE